MRECGVAAARETDVILLTVPADQDMASVLAVAVRVVGIRSGLTDEELEVARAAAAGAFAELVERTRARVVHARLEISSAEVWLRLRAGKLSADVALQSGS